MEQPASPTSTARRTVSATSSGESAKPFSRSALTGRSVAPTRSAAWASASSRVTLPSLRPRVAACPALVVASAWKPTTARALAVPTSQALASSSGSGPWWSARKRAARSVVGAMVRLYAATALDAAPAGYIGPTPALQCSPHAASRGHRTGAGAHPRPSRGAQRLQRGALRRGHRRPDRGAGRRRRRGGGADRRGPGLLRGHRPAGDGRPHERPRLRARPARLPGPDRPPGRLRQAAHLRGQRPRPRHRRDDPRAGRPRVHVHRGPAQVPVHEPRRRPRSGVERHVPAAHGASGRVAGR